jgi:hypothetical protein
MDKRSKTKELAKEKSEVKIRLNDLVRLYKNTSTVSK